jgi:nickel-dependent lactate racemase
MGGIRRLVLNSLGKTYELGVAEDQLLLYHEPPSIPLADPKGAVEQALLHPIDTPPLEEAARGAAGATVIVDDWGRSEATRKQVAPLVVDHLNRAGIPDERITLLIARGLGLAPSMALVSETFGAQLWDRPVQKGLSAIQRSGQKFLGFTSYGTPVWIDRRVAEADFVVGIGSVFPSPWGGWSGGAKIVVPGIASPETIQHNHSLMIQVSPGSWDHPAMADREEAAALAKLGFLVNLVLTPQGQIAAVGAGELKRTHRRMAEAFIGLYSAELPAKPDVVVTTIDWWKGPQAPMDSLYGFVDQSLTSLPRIADPGATIIGIGYTPGGIWAGMREYMRTCYTLEDLAELRYKGGTLGFIPVLQAIQFKLFQSRYRVVLAVEGIDAQTLSDMGFETAPSGDEALKKVLPAYGAKARVAVLPALGCPNWPVLKER